MAFGSEDIDSGTLPSEVWELKGNIETDYWFISGPDGAVYEFRSNEGQDSNGDHPLVQAGGFADLEVGEAFTVELRQLMEFENVVDNPLNMTFDVNPRFDLFINGVAIGHQHIPQYNDHTANPFGLPFIGSDTISFIGFGADGVSLSVDALELRGFNWLPDRPNTLEPSTPTPMDFSNSERPEVFKRVFFNDFGTVDGSSFDADILGYDTDGLAYRATGVNGEFERLENPNVSQSYCFNDGEILLFLIAEELAYVWILQS